MSVNWKYSNKKRKLNADDEEVTVDLGDLLQKNFENVSSDISLGGQGKIRKVPIYRHSL